MIGLDDLEASLSGRLLETARSLAGAAWSKHTTLTEPSQRVIIRGKGSQKAPFAKMVGRGALIGLGTGLLGLAGALAINPSAAPASLMFGWFGFCLSMPFQILFHNRERLAELRRSLTPEEVTAFIEATGLAGAEKTYCAIVALLIELERKIGASVAADILRELNLLLEQHRQLETYRTGLVAAMSTTSMDELEKKEADLRARLEQTDDPVAREAVQQSLDMLTERSKSAAVLEPSLERVEAQLEVLMQTFATVHGSVARLKVAPAQVEAPDLYDLFRSVTEVSGQTKAVEQAVQEVMALGAS